MFLCVLSNTGRESTKEIKNIYLENWTTFKHLSVPFMHNKLFPLSTVNQAHTRYLFSFCLSLFSLSIYTLTTSVSVFYCEKVFLSISHSIEITLMFFFIYFYLEMKTFFMPQKFNLLVHSFRL